MKSRFDPEFLAGSSALHRGAAALVALLACAFFAPVALAAPSAHPAAAAQPAALTRAAAPGAATADPEAGSVATTPSPADRATGSQQVVLPADDGQTTPAAPADAAAPPATSTTGQSADSAATATQQQPINIVVIVRINSPGNDGPITQNNITVASSTAANKASTLQGGVPSAASTTTQQATPTASATQAAAGNLVRISRLASPGKDSAVAQTNAVLGAATGTNTSSTTQQVAAPKPAVEPQPHRAGAAASRKPTRLRQPAATDAAPATLDAAPAATTPHRAAIQKRGPAHRHPAVAQKSHSRTRHLPTLSGIASGAAKALSSFVPHTSPVAGGTHSDDVSRPVLLTLLLAAAVAATFALVRRAPARRRPGSWRTPR